MTEMLVLDPQIADPCGLLQIDLAYGGDATHLNIYLDFINNGTVDHRRNNYSQDPNVFLKNHQMSFEE